MAITVKKKCNVGEEVLDIYKIGARKALEVIFNNLRTMRNKQMQANFLSKRRGDIARLNDVVKGVSAPGRGLDKEMARLRGIDFDWIDVKVIRGDQYIVAQTKDLRIVSYVTARGVRKGDTYDHGDYKIYVPRKVISTSKIASIQFIPDEAPWAEARHYHHKANNRTRAEGHPIQMDVYSCWGGFAEPMAANLSYCDLPELFRMLRVFIGRYNPGSPLANPTFGRGFIGNDQT